METREDGQGEQAHEERRPWAGERGKEDASLHPPAVAPTAWLTLTQAAELLGVSRRSVLRLLDRGELLGVRVVRQRQYHEAPTLGNGTTRVTADSVVAYLRRALLDDATCTQLCRRIVATAERRAAYDQARGVASLNPR